MAEPVDFLVGDGGATSLGTTWRSNDTRNNGGRWSEVDTRNNVVRMEERNVEKGFRLREAISESRPGATMQDRDLLVAASSLNFLRWVVPGGFRHLRSGWDAANESGVMNLWRAGAKRASAVAAISEDLRNDMAWRRKMLSPRLAKRL